MISTRLLRFVGMSALGALALTACGGIGYVRFVAQNGGPSGAPAAHFASYDIQCTDTFAASGGRSVLGNAAGVLGTHCEYQGHSMEFAILGEFHAAPMARNHWTEYRQSVIERARTMGCPAVAVRTAPPTHNQEGEAVGAFCVNPG